MRKIYDDKKSRNDFEMENAGEVVKTRCSILQLHILNFFHDFPIKQDIEIFKKTITAELEKMKIDIFNSLDKKE